MAAFPASAPILDYEFESLSRVEFWGFSVWHFLKLVVRGRGEEL